MPTDAVEDGGNGSTGQAPSAMTPGTTSPPVPRATPNGTSPPATAPGSNASGTVVTVPVVGKVLKASIYSHGDKLTEFLQLVELLEQQLGVPVWMLVQNDEGASTWASMTDGIADALRAQLAGNTDPKLAVLVHSPGGSAACAYQLSTAFARRRDGFVCIVPRYAKSAATLMALGASRIILGRLGELGPLDAQILDTEREEFMSALDEVQSLERLHKFALDALDATMRFLAAKTLKKVDTILPMATQFVHGMVQPLFASIDAVHYTQLSRTLKVAEEYAVRLMEPRLGRQKAVDIANRLISTYPEHGFVIDLPEIERIGLDVEEADGNVATVLDAMVPLLGHVSAIGHI